ncbi:potassium channel family protein [Thioalkalicoccus limnaeus]|uniref:Potassium channel family protein n=1 Tax=Thioalkalicoccus limnaeus TaxID=120681 RepID=A0ABV4BCH7_9GAMM
MKPVVFLVLRRMRAPLLAPIAAYAIAVVGLVLIPGQDANGEPWRMTIFHALYFVSFMSTTIGFGEIPYAFTNAQRLWVLFCIFLTVSVWLYAIGKLIALLQDKTFQRALAERRFATLVRRLSDPFYLVCGYGETGSALVQALTDRHQRAVVIDIKPERIALLQLENLREFVPALAADARQPHRLLDAGLSHPLCAGAVALTNVNATNLKIAITAKLLHPRIKVICRADSRAIEANMASFGTDHIFDPFETFALSLATRIHSPQLTRLYQWLTSRSGMPPAATRPPPAEGRWILCGYGRFGRALHKHLADPSREFIVIEAQPDRTGRPTGAKLVTGPGTEADTLEQASVCDAVGLVAGTDDDANNLSIIMTARELNRDLFVVARENQSENHGLFFAVEADIIMHPSTVLAERIAELLGTPLLTEFCHQASHQDDDWAGRLLQCLEAMVSDQPLAVWETRIEAEQAPAVATAVETGTHLDLATLNRNPRDREDRLPCLVLLRLHGGEPQLLPDAGQAVQRGDQLLMCGQPWVRQRLAWTLQDPHALAYVLTGETRDGFWHLAANGRRFG